LSSGNAFFTTLGQSVDIPITNAVDDNNRSILYFRKNRTGNDSTPPHEVFFGYVQLANAISTPTPTPSLTPSPIPTDTPNPTATDSPTPSPTDIPTPTSSPAPTDLPTLSPVPTATPTPTVTPTPSPITITKQISASSDDANQDGTTLTTNSTT